MGVGAFAFLTPELLSIDYARVGITYFAHMNLNVLYKRVWPFRSWNPGLALWKLGPGAIAPASTPL